MSKNEDLLEMEITVDATESKGLYLHSSIGEGEYDGEHVKLEQTINGSHIYVTFRGRRFSISTAQIGFRVAKNLIGMDEKKNGKREDDTTVATTNG